MTYPHLTKENLRWLFEVAYVTAGKGGITPQSLKILNKARALILNKTESVVDCFSCVAKSEDKVSVSILEQHKPTLKAYREQLMQESVIQENNSTYYHIDKEVITLPIQESPNYVDDSIIVEQIVSIESTPNEINVKTVKAKK